MSDQGGGAGTNIISTGDGDNNITLGNGSNNLTLGNGNNTVKIGNGGTGITLGSGNNTIDSQGGDYLIDFSSNVTGLTITQNGLNIQTSESASGSTPAIPFSISVSHTNSGQVNDYIDGQGIVLETNNVQVTLASNIELWNYYSGFTTAIPVQATIIGNGNTVIQGYASDVSVLGSGNTVYQMAGLGSYGTIMPYGHSATLGGNGQNASSANFDTYVGSSLWYGWGFSFSTLNVLDNSSVNITNGSVVSLGNQDTINVNGAIGNLLLGTNNEINVSYDSSISEANAYWQYFNGVSNAVATNNTYNFAPNSHGNFVVTGGDTVNVQADVS